MKTVDIKGRKYVTVNERIKYFVKHKTGYALLTEIIKVTDDECIIRATAYDENNRPVATGHAQEFRNASNINKTSYVENCETSAIGRCLAVLGIGIDEEIASADEVQNALERANSEKRKVTKAEIGALKMRVEERGRDLGSLLSYYDRETIEELTFGEFMNAMKILEK